MFRAVKAQRTGKSGAVCMGGQYRGSVIGLRFDTAVSSLDTPAPPAPTPAAL